ncbi:PAS domain S-box protein [Luteolibacter pohnpeiensis]|uniref:histidine kinase n=1 Tax=Luteolibacter pohnpeiensis TaxID=454153 RepID=A0A934VVQ3_9BACT|nr:PAS domain S-box protein [Luteolibacter pohnpeiensis]MBK1882038.1 PAS domain S-box protein [Luteolibacter pohnpeiensis]
MLTPRDGNSEPLHDSAEWFRLLFERSADAMTLVDPATGMFVDCNEASAKAVGAKDRSEMIGISPAKVAPDYQPDGRTSREVAAEAISSAIQNGSHRFEWLLRRLDGRETHVDVVATALSSAGRTLILTTTRNIERSKQIEADLRISETRWRRVFEQLPMSMQVFAPDGTSRQINSAYEKLFHLSAEDLIDFNILQDEQLQKAGITDNIRSAFEGDISVVPPIPFELRLTSDELSRGLKWIGSTMFPVFDAEGKIIEVVCVHEDHTDRKLAEYEVRLLNQNLEQRIAKRTAALRESEEKFKALFEFSPLGMARVSWEGDLLQVNESFARTIGYTPEETTQLTYWDITPEKYRDQELLILDLVKREGRFGPFEKEYIHRDGHLVPIVINGMLIRGIDGQEELWGIVEDITPRRQAEQTIRESEKKFRTLFEESSHGVMLHAADHCFSEVNPAAAEIFGMSPAEFVGKHPASLAPEYQSTGELSSIVAEREIRKCLEAGTARFEWTHIHTLGHEIQVEVVLSRIQSGAKHLMQAVVTDISERKRAETELKRALERERELNQLKSNFVSMVSHEFRTPLGIIQSSAEILHDYLGQLEAAERDEQLQSIIKNSKRMAGLMEDVLLLGRLDSGRMEFLPRPLDLSGLCRRLVDEVRSSTENFCPIEFSTARLPLEALVDERLLRHILLNLLNNAVKYSKDQQPVKFRAQANDHSVIFQIRDHGIGIPDVDLPSLFEAFRRGSNVGQTPGTGLGLVIVKQSVELHQGQIEVETRQSSGTTFTVTIPLFPELA